MKVVILAGGAGTRLAELTDTQPKPMVEIGREPIIWHIMKLYSFYGFNEFIILLGYQGYVIKEYFVKYFLNHSDMTIDLKNNDITVHDNLSEPWKITLVDTGMETMTGGRIKKAQKYIGSEQFLLTYGDAVSDVDIKQLVEFHHFHGKLITVTTVQSPGRFGVLNLEKDGTVCSFQEKPEKDGVWINAGFFVCHFQIFDYIESDSTVFEKEPLEAAARHGQLMSFRHNGFWQCMDTLHDKNKLEQLWNLPLPPWKVWQKTETKNTD